MRPPPPTPPDIRVRIRRFGGLSEHLFPREGWSPGFENARRRGCFGPCTATPSGFTFQRLAYRTDGTAFLPHGTFEMPVSTSRFQPFRPSVELLRLLCRLLTSPPRSWALRPAQSGHPDTSEISRGKTDRLHRTAAEFTTPILDGRGLRDHQLARPIG